MPGDVKPEGAEPAAAALDAATASTAEPTVVPVSVSSARNTPDQAIVNAATAIIDTAGDEPGAGDVIAGEVDANGHVSH